MQQVDGVNALKLVSVQRSRLSPRTLATKANLALLTVRIPPGFTHVRPRTSGGWLYSVGLEITIDL
jgi:hypothetical protein